MVVVISVEVYCDKLRVSRVTWHTFLLIISIGRLEATAGADGDIGRSSQLDHLKELDLYFSELYWSIFLGAVHKNRYRNKTAFQKNAFVCFRTKNASAHANRLFITKSPLMIGTVFLWKRVINDFRGA